MMMAVLGGCLKPAMAPPQVAVCLGEMAMVVAVRSGLGVMWSTRWMKSRENYFVCDHMRETTVFLEGIEFWG